MAFFRTAHLWCVTRPLRGTLALFLGLGLILVGSATTANILIQRSVNIDGSLGDWTGGAEHPEPPAAVLRGWQRRHLQPGDDLDCATMQSTGRDLKTFSFTFDDDYLPDDAGGDPLAISGSVASRSSSR